MDINAFLDAIATQHWPVVAGFVIVFLVYAANRFGLQNKIGAKYIPWVASGLGILSSIGAQLMLGGDWQTAVEQGFLAGAAATGLWEMLLKHVLPTPTSDAKS